MGILDRFRVPDTSVPSSITAGLSPDSYPIASPWTSSNLQRIVFDDVFGKNLPVNTRASAMRLAPVARARNLLVTTIARFPVVAGRQEVPDPALGVNPDGSLIDDGFRPLETQPSWLYRTDDGTSPQHRMAYTIDDLIFYGASLWWRKNGADSFPIAVGRYNPEDWSIDADMHIVVNGMPVTDPKSVILITGFHEGILSYGHDVLDDARTLNLNVRARLANPVPQLELHQTGGEELTDDEIDALVADWAAARQGSNGGVAYTNEFIEIIERGVGSDSQLMIQARNASAVDQARIVGVAASKVDATADKASLNYETTTGRNQEFSDYDLALYTEPVVARLSMDDVSPHGTKIRFQMSDFTGPVPSPTGPAFQD